MIVVELNLRKIVKITKTPALVVEAALKIKVVKVAQIRSIAE